MNEWILIVYMLVVLYVLEQNSQVSHKGVLHAVVHVWTLDKSKASSPPPRLGGSLANCNI